MRKLLQLSPHFMAINTSYHQLRRLSLRGIIFRFCKRFRIKKYQYLSDCKRIEGKAMYHSAVLINGLGSVVIGEEVHLGVEQSPSFFSSYIYLEARQPSAKITIGNQVFINNNACLISEGAGIRIADEVLIGPNFSVYDSDFHEIDPQKRHSGNHQTKEVVIHKNVFIGSNVTILKGVEIGENTIIGSGSVVSSSIEKNVIAAGNPCKVIKQIYASPHG